jgi:hypothetical protein
MALNLFGPGTRLITAMGIMPDLDNITLKIEKTKERRMQDEDRPRGKEVTVHETQIGKCRDCNQKVGWLTSARTGKKYPVNVKDDPFSDEYLAITNDFHRCG